MFRKLVHTMKLLIVKNNREFYCFLRKELKIKTRNPGLYEQAFLHRSASITHAQHVMINNERLEYLGDAVLDAIIADYLFKKFPSRNEGFLTQMRSKIVKRAHLESVAQQMGLDRAIVCHSNLQPNKRRIFGDALEALIGAMYLDKGYNKTRKYVVRFVMKNYVNLNDLMTHDTDFKSRLIEWGQKQKIFLLFDTQENESIADRRSPLYTTMVKVRGNFILGRGIGSSKKEAEQSAAEHSLEFIASGKMIPEQFYENPATTPAPSDSTPSAAESVETLATQC